MTTGEAGRPRNVRVMFNGVLRDALEIPIESTTERWTEVVLSDGAVLRAKAAVVSVSRITDEYDAEGNPAYAVKSAPVVAVVSVPDNLRRPN